MRANSLLPFLFLIPVLVAAEEEGQPLPFPDLGPAVGSILSRDYYDRSRFRPQLMVERALRSLEGAEIRIDTSWSGDLITVRIADTVHQVPAPQPKNLDQAMALIEKVRVLVEDQGGFPAQQGRDLAYALINGALSSLDPHTVLMPPEPASDFDEDIRGEFGGIGAYLHQDAATGEIIIERVMPERPAEKAGVQDGDVVVAVDGESTAGLSLDQTVRRIKGPKGTTVRLTLRRKAQVIDIAVERGIVQVPTMARYRKGDIGYVRMDEFNQNTARDLFEAIMALMGEGPLKGLVLDLRYNGGGLLDQARLVSDFFLTKNHEIVRTVTVGGEPQKSFSSPRQLYDAAMIVLVSPGSASAAEILSGALQTNDRAVVAGTSTFGKGSVQSIRPMRDGSRLKLTIQEYQLADGVSIQDVGVTPDLRLIRRTLREDGSVDLIPYSPPREEDEEFSLEAKNSYQHAASYEIGWVAHARDKEAIRKSSISARDFEPDQEASLVMSLLASAVTQDGADAALAASRTADTERQELIRLLKDPVQRQAEEEAQHLAEDLAKRTPPVVWGKDTPAPAGALNLHLEPGAPNVAGANAELRFVAANSTGADLGRLYGVIVADRGCPFYEDEVIFGQIQAGGEVVVILDQKVPVRTYEGDEKFTLELRRDGQMEAVTSLPVTARFTSVPRPHLSYTWALKSEGDMIAPDVPAILTITVVNDGVGASLPINLSVYKDNDSFVRLEGGIFRLESLPAGGSSSVEVPLTVVGEIDKAGKKERYSGSEVALQIHAEERFEEDEDARYRASLYHKLVMPVGKVVTGGTVRQPALSMKGDADLGNDRHRITVKVDDDNLRFVACFLGPDKIDMRPAEALADGSYAVEVILKPGLNMVRFVATDGDEVTELLPLRLWGPAEAVTATTTAEIPTSAPVMVP